MPGRLTVIGDLVEDVIVWHPGPVRHGTDNPSEIIRARGGSAANVAMFAVGTPGVSVRFVGRVGDDLAGERLVAEMDAAGVETSVIRGGVTGTVVVLVDATGERTMFADRAAAAQLGPVSDRDLAGTTVLHMPAYGLAAEPMRSTLLGAAAGARALGAIVSVDVSAASLVDELGSDVFHGLLSGLGAGVVLANREEAEVLGLLGRLPPPGALFVVKDGPRPAVIVTHDGHRTEVPAIVVETVRDTTGAGDAFAAGFLTARILGADLASAGRQGHLTAAQVLTTPGAVRN